MHQIRYGQSNRMAVGEPETRAAQLDERHILCRSICSMGIHDEFELDAIRGFQLSTGQNEAGLIFKFDNMRFITKR